MPFNLHIPDSVTKGKRDHGACFVENYSIYGHFWIFWVRVGRFVCICAVGADRGSPPSSRRRQRSPALHLNFRISLVSKKRRKGKNSSFFFGPSGEIRTPGILNPKAQIFLFLNFYTPFSSIYSERSCFPELSVPLFPGVRILSMVKNVVKSKHSPKGIAFRGVLSSSEVS